MTDKSEALSQPIGYISNEGLCALNRGASAVIFPQPGNTGNPTYSQEYVTALIQRSKAAEQREEHLKADAAVMGQRIANQSELTEQLGKSLDEANKTAQGWMERAKSAEQQLTSLPADWSKDSSLETWFPFTAAKLAELEQPIRQHFLAGYDDGHSRGLTMGKLYKGDDQTILHRRACVDAYIKGDEVEGE